MKQLRSCLKLLSLLTVSSLGSARGCDKGWVRFKDHCYFVSQQRVTFEKALIECNGMGGSLAVTDTTEKSDWLRLHLTIRKSGHVYVGGTDLMDEGTWRWVKTGEVIGVNLWRKSEPNGQKTENCLILDAGDRYGWTDIPCTSNHGFVCEK